MQCVSVHIHENIQKLKLVHDTYMLLQNQLDWSKLSLLLALSQCYYYRYLRLQYKDIHMSMHICIISTKM